MDYQNIDKMVMWEQRKALFLLSSAIDLNMDISGYGETGVDEYSGDTYIVINNYNFCLYMPINCDLSTNYIYVMYTDQKSGEESEKSLSEFSNLAEIENWIKSLEIER